MPQSTITIEGSTVCAVTPEGQKVSLELAYFQKLLSSPLADTGQFVLPPGSKCFFTRGATGILIHETSPRVCNFKWIAADSPKPYGRGATYRQVRIALPYVIVYAVFDREPNGLMRLSGRNECFFSNERLTSLDQQLYYPALLNCSKFSPPESHPLSWICTQYLKPENRPFLEDANEQLDVDLRALMGCLYDAGFNYSSEQHEASSWFSESNHIDKRLRTIEAWEQASAKNPLFPLEAPWIPTEHTAGAIAERIFRIRGENERSITTVDDVLRILSHHASKAQKKAS
jgi:hypothetical protein